MKQYTACILIPLLSCFALSVQVLADTVEVKVETPQQLNHSHDTDSASTNLVAMSDIEDKIEPEISSSVNFVEQQGKRYVDVDQLVDMDSIDPNEVFRFSPDYVEIEPGDTIRFLNSLGKHTVLSIKSMLPEGAEPFAISHQKVAEVQFDVPGVYGIRCKVHTRYGMVMLVKVGDELSNLETAKKVKINKRAKKKLDVLFEKLEAGK